MVEKYAIVYMYRILFIHSSVNGHLGCFHVQNSVCQRQGPLGRMSSQNGCPRVYVPRVSSSCLLPLQEVLQDQQVRLMQVPSKLLLLPWVPEQVGFCMHRSRVGSLFPLLSGTPESKLWWPQRPLFLEPVFLLQCPGLSSLMCGLDPLVPFGESLRFQLFSHLWVIPWGYGSWFYEISAPTSLLVVVTSFWL